MPVNSLKRSIAIPFFFVSSASLLLIFDIHTEKKSRVFKKLCVLKIRLACGVRVRVGVGGGGGGGRKSLQSVLTFLFADPAELNLGFFCPYSLL